MNDDQEEMPNVAAISSQKILDAYKRDQEREQQDRD